MSSDDRRAQSSGSERACLTGRSARREAPLPVRQTRFDPELAPPTGHLGPAQRAGPWMISFLKPLLLQLLALLLAPVIPACIPSNVLAPDDRTVQDDPATLAWSPAQASDLPGLWRTRSIEGAAAAVLLDLSYWISADGRFSGAALFAGPPPEYQVLSGRWTLTDDGSLLLGDDAEPARVEIAGGLLRLQGAEGSLILERAQLR